ncbi:MAG: PAS domain-containing protein [Deltaproteobacteria bacterium]|jgi:PAS domain S-box-containing protein|nr:PAS domain-containing protein [Deltaproteobacteria bacterium]
MSNTARQSDNLKNFGGGRKNLFRVFAVLVLLTVAGLFAGAWHYGRIQVEQFEESAQKEINELIFSRIANMSKLFASVVEPAVSFISSEQIKGFAAHMEDQASSIPVLMGSRFEDLSQKQRGDLADIQFVQHTLQQLISYSEFSFGTMLNIRGDAYLKTEQSYPDFNNRQKNLVHAAARTGRTQFGPARPGRAQEGLVLEIYLPIPAPGKSDDSAVNVVSVLYLTLPIKGKMSDLLNLEGYAAQGYAAILLQRENDTWQQVLYHEDRLRDLPPVSLGPDNGIAFALRDSITGGRKVYSQGLKATELDWWVFLELDYNQSRGALDNSIRGLYELAGLASLVLILLLSAIWRWSLSVERARSLAKIQELFALLDEQKELLDSINGTIAEPISLTNTQGIFIYVNQAFADAFARDILSIPGLDMAAVCGFDTAKRMNSVDQRVIMTGESVTSSEVIWLQSKRHHFQISKAPLRKGEDQSVTGIVSVYRDVTKLVETEERSRRVVQQTIDALVRTIEQADPFLGGHSRIMAEVAKLLSTALHLSDKEVITIETAANLSQIGKMFVPREVLTKPGALTPEEKKLMEQHVEHTIKALEKIEFDLPVLAVIAQMNERPDGQGYPKGLKGDAIGIHARVLAVANAFAAMARPRSYRPAMEVDKVLSIMEAEHGSYDQQVVGILREVLHTPAGERLVAQAAKSRAD